MTDKDQYAPADFVYVGRRFDVSGKLFAAICIIEDDKTLGDERWYTYRKSLDRSIGCIYTGASFNKGGSSGLVEAKWSGKQWPDREAVLGWQAKDRQATTDDRFAKLEKAVGKIDEIERQLLPARRVYDTYRKQGDFAGCRALQEAVVRALQRSPRREE